MYSSSLYCVLSTQLELTFNSLVSVDISVYHRGFHGDLNETFQVGNVSDEAKKLVKTTWECLSKSIEMGESCTYA